MTTTTTTKMFFSSVARVLWRHRKASSGPHGRCRSRDTGRHEAATMAPLVVATRGTERCSIGTGSSPPCASPLAGRSRERRSNEWRHARTRASGLWPVAPPSPGLGGVSSLGTPRLAADESLDVAALAFLTARALEAQEKAKEATVAKSCSRKVLQRQRPPAPVPGA